MRRILTFFISLVMITTPVISMADNPDMSADQTAVWAVSAVILIGIIGLLVFFKKRENRIRQDIRDNPDKYYSVERRPGDTKLILRCMTCNKQYTIYVNPKDASFVRRNRERCPECDAIERARMRHMSGRSGWL